MPTQDIGISCENLALIADVVRRILQDNSTFPGLPGLSGPTGLLGIKLPTLFNHHDAKFYAAKLGFFDLYFDGKSTTIDVDTDHTLRDTYF